MNTKDLWKDIANVTSSGIVIVDEWNVVLFQNRRAEFFGLKHSGVGSSLPKWLISEKREENYQATNGTKFDSLVVGVSRERIFFDGKPADVLFLRDETEQEARKNEMLLCQKAFDAVNDLGMMVLDASGKVLLYNAPSARNDGLMQKDVLGRNIREIFTHQTISTQEEVLRTGKPVIDQEMCYVTETGKRVSCFGSTYPIKKNEVLVGVFSIIRFNESIRTLLARTIELQRELAEVKSNHTNGTRYHFEDIIGKSPAIVRMLEIAKKAALSPSTVLIYGETGTGKELVAQSIHNASPNRDEPFVAINCAAIPDTLLESTLFGTTKGAYTGAQSAPGLFEQAKKGTLFLDEINSMPMNLQAKLLRVLQEKRVRRVGAQTEIAIECRVISSCNKSPQECVEKEILRADLYYRLSVICVEVPPLRERGDDLLYLANCFIQKYAGIYGAKAVQMTDKCKGALLAHQWSGNVRELQHVMESAIVLLEPGEMLGLHHLQPYLRDKYLAREKPKAAVMQETLLSGMPFSNLKDQLVEYERRAILAALEKYHWNVSRVAREIGYTRSNLQYRMRKLGITVGEEVS